MTSWLEPTSTLTHQSDVVRLFVYPVVFVAALHVYFHWRLTGDTAAGVLSAWLFATAVQGLSRAALGVEHSDALAAHAIQLFLVDVLFTMVVLLALTLLPERGLGADPGALGITVGIVFGVLELVAVTGSPAPAPGVTASGALQLFLLALQLAVAVALLRLPVLPDWVRIRVAVGTVLLSVSHAITQMSRDEARYAVLAIVTDLLGATLLAGTMMALLRASTRRRRLEIAALLERVEEAERDDRDHRERLHEIVSTVAGIACATRLMQEPGRIPGPRREQLSQMVTSEVARLERLLEDGDRATTDVDLDETVRPLVVAHRARGQEVHWTPTGLQARGRQDDIAEVVNVLLDNAAKHAPGAGVSITGREVADGIEVRVRDTGPGIPRDLANLVFLHGHRGPTSTGQGIGLNVAERLMADMGGSLQLLGTSHGTTFVLRMPNPRSAHVEPPGQAQ